MDGVWREFPDTWTQDRITKHIDAGISNIVGIYKSSGPAYPALIGIDGIFKGMVDGLVNTEFILEALLLMRAHSAFLAGSMLAMAGHATESFMVYRGVLENALYALHINRNSDAGAIWLNRHRDDDSLTRSKKEFTYRRVIKTFRAVEQHIANVADRLYRRTIDFGAHPNEQAATSSMQIVKEEGKTTIRQTYLAGGTLPQTHALKSGAQVGVCSLYAFRGIYRERFDILGLTQRVDKLRNQL